MVDLLFLIPIISFLGIFVGILLKKIAWEEVKFGKFGGRYFVWMKRIILFLLIIINLLFFEDYLFLGVGILLGFLLGVFLGEYLFLGTSLVLGFLINSNLLFINSSLVFLYGLPYGSIKRRIKLKEIVFLAILFFIPFLLTFFSLNISFLAGVVSGGLFNYLIRK